MIQNANERRKCPNNLSFVVTWSGKHISEQIMTKVLENEPEKVMHYMISGKDTPVFPV
jgi:hypothetical protein